MEFLKKYIRYRKKEKEKGFYNHLIAYVFISAMLVFVNILYSKEIWFHWVILGWGMGVMYHYINGVKFFDLRVKRLFAEALKRAGGDLEKAKEMYPKVVRERAERNFRIHLIIYIMVNAYLVVINLLEGGYFWAIYPIVFWGLGVLVNYLAITRIEEKIRKDIEIVERLE